jgi:hypothetical protein
MDDSPRTRQESKKNQKQKGRADKLGSSKSVRQYEAMMERKQSSVKGGGAAAPANNSGNKK